MLGQPEKNATRTPPKVGDLHSERFYYALACITGYPVHVNLMNGSQAHGIFHSAGGHQSPTSDASKDFNLILSEGKELPNDKLGKKSSSISKHLLINSSQFESFVTKGVPCIPGGSVAQSKLHSKGFATDSELSGMKDVQQRELVAWVSGSDQKDNRFKMEMSLDGQLGADWDQFEENRKRHNVRDTYDENLYTTKLTVDHLTPDQIARADRIAFEIEKLDKNPVGKDLDLDNMDANFEEMKYGAVVRNDQVSKAARNKQDTLKNAPPAPPSSTSVRPTDLQQPNTTTSTSSSTAPPPPPPSSKGLAGVNALALEPAANLAVNPAGGSAATVASGISPNNQTAAVTAASPLANFDHAAAGGNATVGVDATNNAQKKNNLDNHAANALPSNLGPTSHALHSGGNALPGNLNNIMLSKLPVNYTATKVPSKRVSGMPNPLVTSTSKEDTLNSFKQSLANINSNLAQKFTRGTAPLLPSNKTVRESLSLIAAVRNNATRSNDALMQCLDHGTTSTLWPNADVTAHFCNTYKAFITPEYTKVFLNYRRERMQLKKLQMEQQHQQQTRRVQEQQATQQQAQESNAALTSNTLQQQPSSKVSSLAEQSNPTQSEALPAAKENPAVVAAVPHKPQQMSKQPQQVVHEEKDTLKDANVATNAAPVTSKEPKATPAIASSTLEPTPAVAPPANSANKNAKHATLQQQQQQQQQQPITENNQPSGSLAAAVAPSSNFGANAPTSQLQQQGWNNQQQTGKAPAASNTNLQHTQRSSTTQQQQQQQQQVNTKDISPTTPANTASSTAASAVNNNNTNSNNNNNSRNNNNKNASSNANANNTNATTGNLQTNSNPPTLQQQHTQSANNNTANLGANPLLPQMPGAYPFNLLDPTNQMLHLAALHHQQQQQHQQFPLGSLPHFDPSFLLAASGCQAPTADPFLALLYQNHAMHPPYLPMLYPGLLPPASANPAAPGGSNPGANPGMPPFLPLDPLMMLNPLLMPHLANPAAVAAGSPPLPSLPNNQNTTSNNPAGSNSAATGNTANLNTTQNTAGSSSDSPSSSHLANPASVAAAVAAANQPFMHPSLDPNLANLLHSLAAHQNPLGAGSFYPGIDPQQLVLQQQQQQQHHLASMAAALSQMPMLGGADNSNANLSAFLSNPALLSNAAVAAAMQQQQQASGANPNMLLNGLNSLMFAHPLTLAGVSGQGGLQVPPITSAASIPNNSSANPSQNTGSNNNNPRDRDNNNRDNRDHRDHRDRDNNNRDNRDNMNRDRDRDNVNGSGPSTPVPPLQGGGERRYNNWNNSSNRMNNNSGGGGGNRYNNSSTNRGDRPSNLNTNNRNQNNRMDRGDGGRYGSTKPPTPTLLGNNRQQSHDE